ncbi:spore coat protein [Bacillus mesophilum]|uniref:Spore coat protein n=1 Tax=Bacillus mesophilum TaxID=1071718 RepID=A0A7V7RKP0_9BACI|nr:spore coat protein [Bacillus mesophilum]KAB2331847.1 spore coat protein [Bacillus mesophilum]
MPNNMDERSLTEREILQLCLELEKARCTGSGRSLLESAHDELRDIYNQCFEHASTNQYKIFSYLEQKGWYETELAAQEQVIRVQELMQNNLHPN